MIVMSAAARVTSATARVTSAAGREIQQIDIVMSAAARDATYRFVMSAAGRDATYRFVMSAAGRDTMQQDIVMSAAGQMQHIDIVMSSNTIILSDVESAHLILSDVDSACIVAGCGRGRGRATFFRDTFVPSSIGNKVGNEEWRVSEMK